MSIRYQDLNLNADQSTYEYLTKDLLGEKKICTIFKAINVIPPFFNFLSPSVKVTEVFQKIQFKSTNEYLFIYFNPLKLKIMKQIAFEAFWSPIGAPELRAPKNEPPQVDSKELPRQSHRPFIFWTFSQILLFGIHLVAAPSVPFIWKINKKALLL